MRADRWAVLGMVAVLLAGSLGCRSAPPVGTVMARLEAELPGAEFEREFHLRLGRLSLGLVKRIADWGLSEDDEDLMMLRRVSHIDIGSYRVVSLPPLDDLRLPPDLLRALDRSGWRLMLRTRDRGECVWLFVREDPSGAIRSLYVVALDEVELTMVSLEGRLDQVLAEAIAADAAGFAATLGS